MADFLVKLPVLGDLLKDEQHNYLGREEQVYDNTAGPNPVPLGTVVEMGSGTLQPWDMSATTPDAADIYGILLSDVPAGVKTNVTVLYAGPAAVDPTYLIWSSSATGKIQIGLQGLKDRKFVFTREPIATGTYPEQIL
jgi:hypothetical protein